MSNKVSDFVEAEELTEGDVLYLVQDGTDKKVKPSVIVEHVRKKLKVPEGGIPSSGLIINQPKW